MRKGRVYKKPKGAMLSWSSVQCERWVRSCLRNEPDSILFTEHAQERQIERGIDTASVLKCIEMGVLSTREHETRKDNAVHVKLKFSIETKLSKISVVIAISDAFDDVYVITVISSLFK